MRLVSKYEAEDGRLFDTETACLLYEKLELHTNEVSKTIYNKMAGMGYDTTYLASCESLARDLLEVFDIKIK